MITFTVERFVLFVGMFVGLVGVWRTYSAWRKTQNETLVARARQEDQMKKIISEVQPDGNKTLAQQVGDIQNAVKDNTRSIDEISDTLKKSNARTDDLHRRIDGLYEMLGMKIRGIRRAEKEHPDDNAPH